jgi:pimeloyl-ACP methyl ester carboxylesterase
MTSTAQFLSGQVSIKFTDAGAGTPVVFVHGFLGSHSNWDSFDFIDGFRMIKVDCRGHGDSDKPHESNAYGVEMVEDVTRLLDHLEIEKAHLVGYSMGAEIIIKFAALHPDRVLSLVVGGSGWSGESDANNYRAISKSLAQGGSLGSFMRTFSPDISDEEIAGIDAMFEQQDKDALAAVAGGMENIVNLPAEAFSTFNFPVLGIAGENDPERGNIEKMADVLQDFSMEVIAGKDHVEAAQDPAFHTSTVAFLTPT